MTVSDTMSSSTLEQANEMYWGGNLTVDEIVKELNIGRSTLYSAVRPIDAGATCPECGDSMVFTNRSNRDSRTATCPSCAAESRLDEADTGGIDQQPRARDANGDALDGHASWPGWREGFAGVSPQRVAMVGGAAALGVVIGAAAARAIRDLV